MRIPRPAALCRMAWATRGGGMWGASPVVGPRQDFLRGSLESLLVFRPFLNQQDVGFHFLRETRGDVRQPDAPPQPSALAGAQENEVGVQSSRPLSITSCSGAPFVTETSTRRPRVFQHCGARAGDTLRPSACARIVNLIGVGRVAFQLPRLHDAVFHQLQMNELPGSSRGEPPHGRRLPPLANHPGESVFAHTSFLSVSRIPEPCF